MAKSCLAQLYFFALFLNFCNLYFVIFVNFFKLLFVLSCNCLLSLFQHDQFLPEIKLNLVLLFLSILIGNFILISLMSQYFYLCTQLLVLDLQSFISNYCFFSCLLCFFLNALCQLLVVGFKVSHALLPIFCCFLFLQHSNAL